MDVKPSMLIPPCMCKFACAKAAMQRAVMHLASLHVMPHLTDACETSKEGTVSHHVPSSALSMVLTPGIEHFKATGEFHAQVSSAVWGAVRQWKRVALGRFKLLLLKLCVQASAKGGHHVHHVLLTTIAVRHIIQERSLPDFA